MNEQLQQALADLIQKSMSAAGDALAFAQEELPDVIQQLLMWKAVESFLLMGAWIILAISTVVSAKKIYRHTGRDDFNEHDRFFVRLVSVFVFLALLSALCSTWAIPEWVQISVAPKVYLLEYAANLAK